MRYLILFLAVLYSAITFSQEVTAIHDIQLTEDKKEYEITTKISGLEGVDLARITYLIGDEHVYRDSPKNGMFKNRAEGSVKFYAMAVPANGELIVTFFLAVNGAGEYAFQSNVQISKNEIKTEVEMPRIYLKSNSLYGSELVAEVNNEEETQKIEDEARVLAEQEAEKEKQAVELEAKRVAEEEAKKAAEAKLLAEQQAKEEAEKEKEAAELEAKSVAEEEAKKAADAKLLAEQQAKEKAEKEKQAAELEAKRVAEEEAKKAAEAKLIAEQQAKEEAEKEKEAAELEAKRVAEEEAKKAAEAKLLAEQQAKEEKQKEEEKLAVNIERFNAEQKAKEEAELEVKRIAEEEVKKEIESKKEEVVNVSSGGKSYTVQILSLSKFSEERLNYYCKKHGLSQSEIIKRNVNGLTKVSYGKVSSQKEATVLQQKLKSNYGINESFIVVLP